MRNIEELLTTGNKAQRKKLEENQHKKPFNLMEFEEIVKLLKEEMEEVQEEIIRTGIDIDALKYECADLANACHMMILHCERELDK